MKKAPLEVLEEDSGIVLKLTLPLSSEVLVKYSEATPVKPK